MYLKKPLPGALDQHLAPLRDSRVLRTQRYPLLGVVFLAFCGILAGCNGWDALAAFAKAKRGWFEQWFDLSDGTPCSDTFQRVLQQLAPRPFAAAFEAWLAHLQTHLRGELVALDGKAIRGAFTAAARTTPLHLLHAWGTRQKVLLGALAVEGAPGEIAGIATLLAMLDACGAVVATDANGCTQANAAAIVDAGADYLFGLKGNRGAIHAETQALFASVPPADEHLQVDKGHGRIEERRTQTLPADLLPAARRAAWKGLRTLVRTERSRTVGSQTTTERHYYLTSQAVDAATVGAQIRTYWGVENELHWVLDATMGEDRCRVRHATAAENLATLRRHALTLLRQPAAGRGSLAMKQRSVGWDETYLLKLLASSAPSPRNQAV